MKKNISKILIVLVIACSTSLPPTIAKAQFGGVATEVTQLVNMAQLFLQVAEQIKTYIKLVEQYENMLENSEKLEELFYDRGIDLFLELAESLVEDGVISYSSETIAEDFAQEYPGYEVYAELEASEWTPEMINEKYIEWNEGHQNNVTTALEAVSLQNAEYEGEMELIEAIKVHSATAVGRNGLIQAGNEAAVAQLAQMQKLRQLIMTQIQMQANYISYEQDKEAAQKGVESALQSRLTEAEDELVVGDEKEY